MQAETKRDVGGFVRRLSHCVSVRDDEDLFQSGLINSLLALQLVLFVEHRFHVSVEGTDLELSNFCSIDAITEFVERKRR